MTSTQDPKTELANKDFTPPFQSEGQMEAPLSPYTTGQRENWDEEPDYDSADRNWEDGLQEKAAKELRGSQERMQQVLLPLLCLSFGSVFFIFGLVLLIFGHDGILTLQWNAERWYVFLLPATALLYFGWHGLPDILE